MSISMLVIIFIFHIPSLRMQAALLRLIVVSCPKQASERGESLEIEMVIP